MMIDYSKAETEKVSLFSNQETDKIAADRPKWIIGTD